MSGGALRRVLLSTMVLLYLLTLGISYYISKAEYQSAGLESFTSMSHEEDTR